MDVIDLMYQLGVLAFLVISFLFYMSRKGVQIKKGHYTRPEWNFRFKRWYAERVVREIKAQQKPLQRQERNYKEENLQILSREESSESQLIYGADQSGNYLLLKFTRFRHRIAELWLILRLSDGRTFTLPEHPNTRINNATPHKFEAHGLTMVNLVPHSKWKIAFSGVLRKGIRRSLEDPIDEDALYFVKFNFFWTAASLPVHWPFDWSSKLMATALATEPWKDGSWKYLLSFDDAGGFEQFGALKGQVLIQTPGQDLTQIKNSGTNLINLNMPGQRIRRWGPITTSHVHRTGILIGVCEDGVVFELGALSSTFGLSHAQFGSIRTPKGIVHPIDWSDFHLAEFAEDYRHFPSATQFNFVAGGKSYQATIDFKHIAHIPLVGGNPLDWRELIVPFEVGLNKKMGFGIAMAWYPLKELERRTFEEHPQVKRMFFKKEVFRHVSNVVRLSDMMSHSIKVGGLLGAAMGILQTIVDEKTSLKTVRKEENGDNVLRPSPSRSISKSRRRLSEDNIVIEENLEELIKAKNKTKYVDSPDFETPEGFLVTGEAFKNQFEQNENLKFMLEDYFERKIDDFGRFSEEISKFLTSNHLNASLKDEIRQHLSKLMDKERDFSFTARLANYWNPDKVSYDLKNEDEIFEAIIQMWISFFTSKSNQQDESNDFDTDEALPIVLIQQFPSQTSDFVAGIFQKLSLNADIRYFSISLIQGGIYHLLTDQESKKLTFVTRRNYDYSSHEIISKPEYEPLSEEMVLKVSKLCSTLEKMLAFDLKIKFFVRNGKIWIPEIENITRASLSKWEILHEFDTAVMVPSEEQEIFGQLACPLSLSIVHRQNESADMKSFYGLDNQKLFTALNRIEKFNIQMPDMIRFNFYRSLSQRALYHNIFQLSWKLKQQKQDLEDFLNDIGGKLTDEELDTYYSAEALWIFLKRIMRSTSLVWKCVTTAKSLNFAWISALFKEKSPKMPGLVSRINLADTGFKRKFLTLNNMAGVVLNHELADEFLRNPSKELFDKIFPVETSSGVEKEAFFNGFNLLPEEMRGKRLFELVAEFARIKKVKSFDEIEQRLLKEQPEFMLEKVANFMVGETLETQYHAQLFILQLNKILKTLGELMVSERTIKNPDLVYFFTLEELNEFIEKKNQKLVQRAYQRLIVFKELLNSPISEHTDETLDTKNATLVYPGEIEGQVYVVDHSQPPDQISAVKEKILVAKQLSTAWLPCFGLVKGLVLESDEYFGESAAMARVFQLPCVCGVKNATQKYVTGDYLHFKHLKVGDLH